MDKITARLALLFCFVLILFVPRTSFAASVDLTVVVHAENGNSIFNFTEADAWTGTGVPPVDFSITTVGGTGQARVTLPNPYYQFNISQMLSDGWRQTDAACVDTASGTQFNYFNNNPANTGGIAVALAGSDHHIVCDVTDQYLDSWSRISYLNLGATALGGDGTFDYAIFDNSTTTAAQVATVGGSGMTAVDWKGGFGQFTVHQNAAAG